MAYTTQANIETRIGIATLGQLTNDNGGDVPDADVVTAMIAKADAFIDNRLNGIYDVPFTTGSLSSVTTPVLIGQLSTDLASYYCMERRPVEYKINDNWKDIFIGIMDTLDKLASLQDVLNDATPVYSEATVVNRTDIIADFYNESSEWSDF